MHIKRITRLIKSRIFAHQGYGFNFNIFWLTEKNLDPGVQGWKLKNKKKN